MRILIDGQTLLTPEINRGIGVYFRKTVEQILANNFTDDFFIAGAPSAGLGCFSPWARQRLERLSLTAAQFANAQTYTDGINEIIDRGGIDLYWSPNPLMLNVFLPSRKTAGCAFAATIFDLIPAVLETHFRKHWRARLMKLYQEKLRVLENDYDLFLHISAQTQSDFHRVTRVNEKRHAVTPLAADEAFRPYPFPAVPGEWDYVLYPGGFDPRKNMDRALEAFAAMKEKYAGDSRIAETALVIVCHKDAPSESELRKRARKLGVDAHLRLTGFVSNVDLVSFYQQARCLFFPSLYEGFGLPVLEGLACGLPIAASNRSSIPEVAGDLASYFDPYDVDDMAAVLYRALNEPRDLASRLKRSKYAQNFSWTKTARATIEAWHCTVADYKSRAATMVSA
jgi:glycosyltransferase involved in cell wall biosynthesis